MIALEPTQFVVVVIIAAPNMNVSHPGGTIIGYVIERGGNPDVVLFPSWPQVIMGKSVEKSKSGLFEPCSSFPVWDHVCGEILASEGG